MLLPVGIKGDSIAEKKIPNPGILGFWEIKCTKYLFRYTHTERGQVHVFIYISIQYYLLSLHWFERSYLIHCLFFRAKMVH